MCNVGGPGCGKSGVCAFLAEQLPGWLHISIGQMLKDEVASRIDSDDMWRTLGEMINHGQLVPDVSNYRHYTGIE